MGAFPLRVLTTTFRRDVTAPGAPLGARRGFASMTPARRLAFPAGSVGCYACTVGLDKGARLGRGIALGVAGALLVFLALTTVQALGNHPPLFYLPESVVMRIDSPAVAIGAARLLSACFGAAGVLMVAWLALILLPSRPRMVVAAAWFVALLPAMPHYSAFVYNDELGFLASTATLVARALALRRGPTRWRMTGLAAAAAAAALTRAPGLTLAGVAGLVAAAAVWLHSGRPVRRRLLAAAGAGAAGLAGAARGRRRVAFAGGVAAAGVPDGRLVRRQRWAHPCALPAAGDRGGGDRRGGGPGRAAGSQARADHAGGERRAAGADRLRRVPLRGGGGARRRDPGADTAGGGRHAPPPWRRASLDAAGRRFADGPGRVHPAAGRPAAAGQRAAARVASTPARRGAARAGRASVAGGGGEPIGAIVGSPPLPARAGDR